MFRSFSSLPRSVVLRVSNRNHQVQTTFQCDLSEKRYFGCVIFKDSFGRGRKVLGELSLSSGELRFDWITRAIISRANSVVIMNLMTSLRWLTSCSLVLPHFLDSPKESSPARRATAHRRQSSAMCRSKLVSFRVTATTLQEENAATIRPIFLLLYLQNI
jgi:hypothetical protein